MSHIKASLSEFVGTFALTFVGAGSMIMVAARSDATGALLIVALAHALILSVMVSATMHISGGQFNPAVSVALGAIGKQPWSRAFIFIAAQLIGSVCAASMLKVLMGSIPAADGSTSALVSVKLGATFGHMNLGPGAVLGLEVIATFFLMWVIMGTAVDTRGVGKSLAVGGFGIGLTVAANILAIGPATGAAMNPARSFGPAFIFFMGGGDAWSMHWVYWIGPLIGATLAGGLYQAAFGSKSSE